MVSSRANRGAGGETYLLRVLRHLDRSRFRPLVVLPAEGNLSEDLDALEIDWLVVRGEHGWLRQPSNWYRFLAATRTRTDRLREIIEQEGVKLVHTNSNHRLEGALAARLAGVHHLYLGHIELQHDMPIFKRFPLSPGSYAQLMGELSSRIVAVSESVASALEPSVPASKLQVIHNGIELHDLDDAAASGASIRAELGLSEDTLLVSAVGRLNPDKGFDFFIDCAHRVLAGGAAAHFLLIGGTEVQTYAEALRARVRDLGIEPQFHFLGFRSDVPALLEQTDVFVLSSRREGHPYVLLEAMARRCPALACRCAGVDETLVEDVTGYAVGIGDVDALAERLLLLLEDATLRQRMGEAARERVEDKFQAIDMVGRLMDAYDRILAEPSPPAGSPAVDLFLNASAEIGRLGSELEAVEERLRVIEGRLEPLWGNPLAKALRRIRHLRSPQD
jgi:glycosyltransferase involved in cell wall biosynthesis